MLSTLWITQQICGFAVPDPFGYRAIVSENQSTMSSPHPCPFIAYTQLPQPSSSNQSFETMLDGSVHHQQWSYFSRPRDIHTHMIAASNRHRPSYSFNTHISLADPASHFSRRDTDALPAGDSVFHPFVLGHGWVASISHVLPGCFFLTNLEVILSSAWWLLWNSADTN